MRETLVSAGYEVHEAADSRGARGSLAATSRSGAVGFRFAAHMGDETLERHAARLRPGLVCCVLSGKDDLHQARSDVAGRCVWLDRQVCRHRAIAGGHRRPRPGDAATAVSSCGLVATSYPEPIAVPFRRGALVGNAPVGERLSAQAQLLEAVVEYLGVAAVATYIHRGLLEVELNCTLRPVLEQTSVQGWLTALRELMPRFAEEPAAAGGTTWPWRVARPLVGGESFAPAQLVGPHTALGSAAEANSVMELFEVLAEYHALWLVPDRLPAHDAEELQQVIATVLDEALSALALLADVELAWIRETTVTAENEYLIHVTVLSVWACKNGISTGLHPSSRASCIWCRGLPGSPSLPWAP